MADSVPMHERLWLALFRRALMLRGSEFCDDRGGSCLVLAPHPDDETLGCGGTIMAKLDVGVTVHVAFACDGAGSHRSSRTPPQRLAELRECEARAACAALGVPAANLHFLRLPDGALSHHATELDRRLADLIRSIDPQQILVCSAFDAHPDHRALNAAAHRVAGAEGRRILEYPIWIWTLRAWAAPKGSRSRRLITAARRQCAAFAGYRVAYRPVHRYLDRKRTALECHATQMGRYAPEPDWRGLDDAFVDNFFTGYELFLERRGAS
jgi:LmbE family N-acetylglucosaminyl deacetylase